MCRRRNLWVIVALVAGVLAGCAGGSGSSGFDAFPENAAIRQALDTQQCVERRGLTLCPADETQAQVPGASPTATATPTPAAPADRTPQAPPTTTPTQVSLRETPTATPTIGRPRIDTGLSDATAVACGQAAGGTDCRFALPFVPEGLPPGTIYRVAVRTTEPLSMWTIGAPVAPLVDAPIPSFDASVAVQVPSGAPVVVTVQLAVLAYLEPREAPTEVVELADSSADYAFISSELTIQPEPAGRVRDPRLR